LEDPQKLKAEIASPPVATTTEGSFKIGPTNASPNEAPTDGWTTEDAKELYLIDRWGNGYFDVNADGKLTIAPLQERGQKIAILSDSSGHVSYGPEGATIDGRYRIIKIGVESVEVAHVDGRCRLSYICFARILAAFPTYFDHHTVVRSPRAASA